MSFLELCKKFIEIDSSTGTSSLPMVEFVNDLAKAKGFKTKFNKYNYSGLTHANLVISNSESLNCEYELVLQGHVDTIDPGHYTLWNKTGKNPFAASIREGRIYGLGVASSKLDLLCKLVAAEDYVNKKSNKSFAIIATSCKEQGFKGAIELLRNQKIKSRYALIGEPTDLSLSIAGKGLAKLEIDIPFVEKEVKFKFDHDHLESVSTESRIFAGVSSHYSQPELGVNAIERMLDYLENMPDNIMIMEMEGGGDSNSMPLQAALEFAVDSSAEYKTLERVKSIYQYLKNFKNKIQLFKDERFKPATTTFNISRVETLEDRIRIKGSVSWPPVVSYEVYRTWIEELKTTCEANGAKVSFTEYIKPFENSKESSFLNSVIKIMKSLEMDQKISTHPDANEAHCFSRFGSETIAFGPGRLEDNSHTPDECVNITDLECSIKFYRECIKYFCY